MRDLLHTIGDPSAVKRQTHSTPLTYLGPGKTYTEASESIKNSYQKVVSRRKRRKEQQTSSGTGAATGMGAGTGLAGWTGTSTCRITSFPTPNMASCSWQPCHCVSYETNRLPEESVIWRMELVLEISWIVELWKAEIGRKGHSPGENLLGPWWEGSLRKKLNSGRARWLLKLKLVDQMQPNIDRKKSKELSAEDEVRFIIIWEKSQHSVHQMQGFLVSKERKRNQSPKHW